MSTPRLDRRRVPAGQRRTTMRGMDVLILVAMIFLAVLGITAQVAGVDSRAFDQPAPTD